VNVPAYPASTTGLARVAPGLVGFLHFFTLGAALPLLPLYLTRTLGYSWTLTGVILTAIPFSLLIGQIFVRTLSELGIDVRIGLALSHLLAAGIAMSAGILLEPSAGASFNWLNVFGLTALYFALLAPSMTWIARVGDASTAAGRSVIRSWRVWGAAGFVAPAWLCESVLIHFPNLVPAIESHEILFLVAGWAGLATAFAAILLPEIAPESVIASEPGAAVVGRAGASDSSGELTESGLGMRLAIAMLLIVVVQRCHYMWNAPFFQSVLEQHGVGRQFVHRLTVADQVFELIGLLLLGTGIVKLGPRLMLVTGTLAWSGRSVLLGWMWESSVSGSAAMACLFAAQVLQGVAIVTFFGTFGVILRLHHGVSGCRRQIMLASVSGILGMLTAGFVAEALLPGGPESILYELRIVWGVTDSGILFLNPWLQGWTGIWLVSSVPSLLAALLVSLSKPSSVSRERLP
jgi:hypothetical protein